ncbi:hypothetical protein PENANT_c010G11772 [Penicillium antarcticum]|uniref:Uncharacterized protein n=1 Tax=Penicillium antarcticum TaxID=416450 RepID=A0A1V6Q7L6_9EURO|nr:hypothetical protein PENANT_c010G11772 [Penicillium antarcticum]
MTIQELAEFKDFTGDKYSWTQSQPKV